MHHLHIFLSSPGDVDYERRLAQEVIERIQNEYAFREQIKLIVVAWDKPGARTAMPAHLEPQEAIDQGLKKPSQCDIVIVIFWARMGTPLSSKHLKPDGSRYRSGTEYEFLDALDAAKASAKAKKEVKPIVLVYRRKQAPKVALDDPKRKEKEAQWDLVEEFFAEFKNPDGSYKMNCNTCDEPSDFKDLLADELRDLISKYLDAQTDDTETDLAQAEEPARQSPWQGSPFPGLRPFNADEAPIFHGRGREIDGLIDKLRDSANRFVAVVGASGSGKSSLMTAGVLPALAQGAIDGSRDWHCVRFTPGELGKNPFTTLVSVFKPELEKHRRRPGGMAEDLFESQHQGPAPFDELVAMALEGRPEWAKLLLFIDQFEELFTLVDKQYQSPFVDLLAQAARTERVRALATMRADFFHRCLDWPVLDKLLAKGTYPLATPEVGALYAMITRPARQAGLTFEAGLEQRILDDTGTQPGALALMAFALSELWEASKGPESLLNLTAYDSFKGVHGAIGKRAEDTFNSLQGEKADLEAALACVFRELVEVDERGTATRRRAPRAQLSSGTVQDSLLNALIDARLLVTSQGEGNKPTVEVAHEAIFTHWPRLDTWIKHTGDALYLRRQVGQAAAEWEKEGQENKYLWPDDRVVDVVGMLDRLGLGLDDLSDTERRFLGPIDRDAMMAELDDPTAPHERRAVIGVRLSLLGDPRPGVGLREDGLPDIVWYKVPGGKITLEEEAGTFRVNPFFIAKYPVTWIQYRAFIEAEDGFKNTHWWAELVYQIGEPGRQFNQRDNHPAENVCWLEAMAFCKWLTAKLGYEIRLPTEGQWQQAATGGNPSSEYPWGAIWDSARTNTYESRLNCSTAVGMYPQGASPVGALDMCGNVWELCLNEYDNPKRINVTGEAHRVVRGGSWFSAPNNAPAACRSYGDPNYRYSNIGFRLCCGSPIL